MSFMTPSFVPSKSVQPATKNRLKFFCIAATLLPAPVLWAQESSNPLPVDTVKLDTISVTATLSPVDTRLAPASGSVISREELETRNADSLRSAVAGEPGVAFSQGGGIGRKTITLRGMDSKHVLTLTDGRRIPASDDVFGHADYQYGWVPMSAVERIEIIRGPMSTLYGSDALGGVINTITRKPGEEWETNLLLRGSTLANSEGNKDSVNGGQASIYTSGLVTERLGLRFTGETSRQDRTQNPADNRQSELEGSRANRGSVAAFLELTPEQSLELQFSRSNEEREFDAKTTRGSTYYESRYDLDRTGFGLTWNGEFTHWVNQVRAYRSKVEVSNERGAGSTATDPQALTDEIIDAHTSRAFDNHWLTLGGEIRRETLENTGLEGGDRDADHAAVFVQDEVALTEQLLLTAGLRYDHQDDYGSEASPRVYLVWEAAPQLIVKGGYGRGFRAPTLKQSSPTYVGVPVAPFQFYGNGDLEPEKIDSYELSVNWQGTAVGLNATVFHSEASDLITNRPIDPANQFVQQFVNVDEARLTGVETGFSWKLHPSIIWQNNFGWLKTKDRGTGDELEYRPRRTFNSFLDWQATASLSARLNAEYTGSQHRADTDDLPAYTLWNASVAKDFGESVTMRAGIDNIGDEHLADKSPNFRHVERGRTVYLSTQLNF